MKDYQMLEDLSGENGLLKQLTIYLDAVRIKVRHDSRVINKAVYLTIAANMDGIKDVLGMWTAENEGAKFRLQVVTGH